MAFEQGMQLGLSAYTTGRRQNLEARQDQRAQQVHDLQMEDAAEVRRVMDEYMQGTQAPPQRAMNFQEGPPAPGEEEPFYPYDGPPAPTPPAAPRPRDDSFTGQAQLGMRLARARRSPEAFAQAAGAEATALRNQRYAQIGDRAEAGDPELLAAVNQQSPHVTIVQRKDGYGLVAVDNDGVGREFSLTKQDLRKLAIGNAMLVDGDLQGGLAMIDAVNKDLAELIAARNSTQIEATKVNNAALTSAANAEYQRGTLAQRQREHADRTDLDRMTGAQYMVDEDGNTHAVAMRHNPRTGTFEPVTGQLPPGLRPFPKGGADKPPKIGRDGDYELIPGTNQVGMWQEGELLSRDAPSPSARPAALKKAGIDENLSDQFARSGELRWIDRGPTAGSEVIFGGKAYKVNDKADIAALNKAMRDNASGALKREETKRAAEVGARNRADRQTFPTLGASPLRERAAGLGGDPLTADDIGAAGKAMNVPQRRSAPIGSPISYRDPMWGPIEKDIARRTGVPVQVLQAVRLDGERSNGNQVSSAGARGVYQFTPSTRALFLRKFGVDAYSDDPREQVLAAALHLKDSYGRTGDWLRAAAGYNGGISAERGTNRTTENIGYVNRVAPRING